MSHDANAYFAAMHDADEALDDAPAAIRAEEDAAGSTGPCSPPDSADALFDLIRADYAARPVSRRIAGAGDLSETPSCRFLP